MQCIRNIVQFVRLSDQVGRVGGKWRQAKSNALEFANASEYRQSCGDRKGMHICTAEGSSRKSKVTHGRVLRQLCLVLDEPAFEPAHVSNSAV